jgi:hypothetical protein
MLEPFQREAVEVDEVAGDVKLGDLPLGAEDHAHMRKVVGFVKRHRPQQPANPVSSRWRYSLMNWGHDPLKQIEIP